MNEPNETYDLVVIGATPGGIAAAVRGARQGLSVLLVEHTGRLGGMIASGLNIMDTLYDGARAPIYDECCRRIIEHYRQTYGQDSPQYAAAIPGPRHLSNARLRYEPHVGQKVMNDLVAAEPAVRTLLDFYVASVNCADRIIKQVTLREMDGPGTRQVSGRVFVDAMYEGDLAALAGAACRVGRESREEYGEPHAGRIFTRSYADPQARGRFPRDAAEGRLNLRPFRATAEQILPESDGQGDRAVQASNFRVCITSSPENRQPVQKPSDYDREAFLAIRHRWNIASGGINNKGSFNVANLIEGMVDYAEADWSDRRKIIQRHKDHALGLIWFLQNDSAVPSELRERAQEHGLAADEFVDNDHFPWHLYIREARRLVGRYVYTQHDAQLDPRYRRAPIHDDAIAITEWPMDSHECTKQRASDGSPEGKVLLSEQTRPGQLPYRCLLPRELDNLLVPVCLSASHVAWGTVRLEPTWMHIGEAAGFAAALAIETDCPPAEIDVAALQRTLSDNRLMISFFNDVDPGADASWIPAVQYLGARGFFASYDAMPNAPLSEPVAWIWLRAVERILAGDHDPGLTAREIAATMDADALAPSMANVNRFRDILTAIVDGRAHAWPADEEKTLATDDPDSTTQRGNACRLIYETLPRHCPPLKSPSTQAAEARAGKGRSSGGSGRA